MLESSVAVLGVAGVAAFLFGRGYQSAYDRELGVLRNELPISVEETAFSAAVPLSVFVFLGLVVAFNHAGLPRRRMSGMVLAISGVITGILTHSLVTGSAWGLAAGLVLMSPSILWLIAFWLYDRGREAMALLWAASGFFALLVFVPDVAGEFRARADKAEEDVGEAVTVELESGGTMEGGMLGATSEFLLLWTAEDGLVRIPTRSVSLVRSE